MGGNYLMYVCMYTMILPLHFSVPIYSPWQKNKTKNSQKYKKRRWALARARIFREDAFVVNCVLY